MSVRLSCPSCNTAFALAGLPADRRATCPRCGDVFPIRGEVTEDSATPAEPTPLPNTKHQTPNTKSGWSIGRTVAVALTLGLIGFAVGLVVYYSRESKPKPQPQPDPPAATTATPPAQLAALGYLPAECNVVVAVQPGPLLAFAARTNQEPRALLAQAGLPQQVLAALDRVGLTLSQIDHIVGGVPVGDVLELRITLVLVLKQPLADEDAFLKKLKAKPAPGKKPRYAVDVGAGAKLSLARVSPTVWVFGLDDKDFAAVERGGFGPGGTQFRGSESDGLRKMIASVPPDAAVWVAADDDTDWAQKPIVKLAAEASPEVKKLLPELSGGRGGVFALTFGEKLRMRLFVRTVDTATADRVRAYFRARAAETESATAGGGGVFALFDAPFDPATLQRFLADVGK